KSDSGSVRFDNILLARLASGGKAHRKTCLGGNVSELRQERLTGRCAARGWRRVAGRYTLREGIQRGSNQRTHAERWNLPIANYETPSHMFRERGLPALASSRMRASC